MLVNFTDLKERRVKFKDSLFILLICLFVFSLDLLCIQQKTIKQNHSKFYKHESMIELGQVLNLNDYQGWQVREVTVSYNMIRSNVEFDWLYNGELIGHSVLPRGLRKEISYTYNRPLPGTIQVRVTGTSGQVQVKSFTADITGEEQTKSVITTPQQQEVTNLQTFQYNRISKLINVSPSIRSASHKALANAVKDKLINAVIEWNLTDKVIEWNIVQKNSIDISFVENRIVLSGQLQGVQPNILKIENSVSQINGVDSVDMRNLKFDSILEPTESGDNESGIRTIKIFDARDITPREGPKRYSASKSYRKIFNNAKHTIQRQSNQRIFIAGGSTGTENWGVDDAIEINGQSFQGITEAYTNSSGPLPSFVYQKPIEITHLIPANQNFDLFFQLADYGVTYGNSPIYIIIKSHAPPTTAKAIKLFTAQGIQKREGKAARKVGLAYRKTFNTNTISIKRESDQHVVIAGDASGKASWGVDDAIKIKDTQFTGLRRSYNSTSGNLPDTVLIPPKDITHLIPPNQDFSLTVELIDYGATYGCTDIYLVIE